jgi:hypothetical protein
MDSKNKKELFEEFDMEHLKDHLNTSFDYDNIKVTEELIQRTQKAIEDGEAPKIIEDNKKPRKYPIFKVAQAAAAVIVIIAGITVAQNGIIKNDIGNEQSAKKAEQSEMTENNSLKAMPSEEENYDVNGFSAKSSDTSLDNEANFDISSGEEIPDNSANVMFGTGLAENETLGEEERVDSVTNESVDMFAAGSQMTQDSVVFTDLLPAYNQISQITIETKEKVYGITDSLSKKKDLLDLLGGFSLSNGENLSGSTNYVIKIETLDNQSYTITISENVQIIEEDSINNLVNYYELTGGSDVLIGRLDEYILSLN